MSTKEFSDKSITCRCWHDASPDGNWPENLLPNNPKYSNFGRLKL
jgi:hypothetical protein